MPENTIAVLSAKQKISAKQKASVLQKMQMKKEERKLERSKSPAEKAEITPFFVLAAVIMLAMAVISLIPLLWMIRTALVPRADSLDLYKLSVPTLENIKRILDAAPFGTYYINTILMVAATLAVQFFSVTTAGYAFARINFIGKNFLFMLFLTQMMISADVLIMPNYRFLSSLGLADTKIGVITSGISYQYAKEALGDKASYLKLGIVNPMPIQIIKDFAAKCEKVYVIEELDDVIETHCKKNGVNVIGKELFSLMGEISQTIVAEKILGEKPEYITFEDNVPVRPPVMCPGCPHRGLFYCLHKLGVMVSGDIGCYTLGATAPLCAMDSTICMGASISGLHGFNKARGAEAEKKSVAVIGDSTFMHSGMTGLVNVAYNSTNSTVIILDNSITGMTGHQQNPTTGKNLKGDPAYAVDLEMLCHSLGIKSVRVVDPYHMAETEAVIKEELAKEEPSVIISRRPCALLKYVKHNPPLKVNKDKCVGCKQCLKIGCPAISIHDGKCVIDHTQCVGCGICKEMCKLGAICD